MTLKNYLPFSSTSNKQKNISYLLDNLKHKVIRHIEVKVTSYKVLSLKSKLKSCGSNVNFQFPIVINEPEKVEIGNDVSFAGYVHIWSSGGVRIGDRVMIGSHTAISSITHDYSLNVMYGNAVLKPVVIDDDVWIGTHAVILPGITIAKGAVIGAGCVVTKDVPEFAIVTGVPGRILKYRFSEGIH